MKASRAAIRQARTLARIEEKLDRVLALMGEVPQPEPQEAEAGVEDATGEEPGAEAKPKSKKG